MIHRKRIITYYQNRFTVKNKFKPWGATDDTSYYLTPGFVCDIFSDDEDCYSLVDLDRVSAIFRKTPIIGLGNWGQGVESKRPFLNDSHQTPNGKNAFYFNGGKYVNHGGTAGVWEFLSPTEGITIACVCGELSNDSEVLFARWEATGSKRIYQLKTNYFTIQSNGGGNNSDEWASYTRPPDWTIIWGDWYPGEKCRVFFNGDTTPEGESNIVINSVTAATDTGNKLCAQDDGAGSLSGAVSSWVVWPFRLTQNQRLKSAEYLQWRFFDEL